MLELRDLKPTSDSKMEVEKESNLIDIRISNELHNKLKVAEFTSVFLATFSIILAILLYEMKNFKEVTNT